MLANGLDIRDDAAMIDDLAGVYEGLEGREREARRMLVEMLLERGFASTEIVAAAAENRLALLPLRQLFAGHLTAREISEQTGVPAEFVLRLRRLGGLPAAELDEPVFGEADLALGRALRLFLDSGLDEAGIGEISRVLGESMARVAAAVIGVFSEAFLKPGDSEDAVAFRFSTMAKELTPAVTPVLVATFNAHLTEATARGMLGRAELEQGHVRDSQTLAVGFADLVGFTRLGGELEVRELGNVAGRFGDLAADVATPPVRLIKTIGDAGMFASPEPAALIEAALSLIEQTSAAELPSVRVGISLGPVLARAGDVFGHTVNLASRVTAVARPDSVLCTQEVRDALPDAFDWSFAGQHRLKGISGAVPLHRARRLDQSPATTEAGDQKASRRPSGDRRRR